MQMVAGEFRPHVSQASAEDSANRVLVVSSAREDQAALAEVLCLRVVPTVLGLVSSRGCRLAGAQERARCDL